MCNFSHYHIMISTSTSVRSDIMTSFFIHHAFCRSHPSSSVYSFVLTMVSPFGPTKVHNFIPLSFVFSCTCTECIPTMSLLHSFCPSCALYSLSIIILMSWFGSKLPLFLFLHKILHLLYLLFPLLVRMH